MEEERCQHGVEARMPALDGHRLSIFAAKLLAGGGQRAVRVWAEAGGETHAIGTLSPEKPVAPVPCLTLGGEFVLRQDSADATVRIYYRFLSDRARAPAARLVEPTVVAGVELEPLDEDDDDDTELEDSDGELDLTMTEFYDLGPPPRDGEEEQQADSEDEDEWGMEYELPSEEDDAEHYDSDNGEDGGEPRKGMDNGDAVAGESSRSCTAALVAAPAGIVVPDGNLLGPARFAAVENTAGFMRVAAAAEAAGDGAKGGDKEILVLYRYTRFSKTWSGRRGVEACRRTKLHWLRFAVPAAGDMATSLAWAGASLGPLIYPALFRRQLHELWSSLAAPASMNSTVPPQAAHLQVVVDVGILRRDDHTPERMAHMRGEMEARMREAWPEYYHVGMELRLPEPVPVPDDEERGESARTAKRRKVAADDDEEEHECSVCLDPMESGGLAAWPGCRHVFHGACVEKTLARSDMCPLCRKKLSDQPVC